MRVLYHIMSIITINFLFFDSNNTPIRTPAILFLYRLKEILFYIKLHLNSFNKNIGIYHPPLKTGSKIAACFLLLYRKLPKNSRAAIVFIYAILSARIGCNVTLLYSSICLPKNAAADCASLISTPVGTLICSPVSITTAPVTSPDAIIG